MNVRVRKGRDFCDLAFVPDGELIVHQSREHGGLEDDELILNVVSLKCLWNT